MLELKECKCQLPATNTRPNRTAITCRCGIVYELMVRRTSTRESFTAAWKAVKA